MRLVFLACGWLFLGLGSLGVVLPLLPTTPFVLLAAYCFARGSRELHAWLHRSRIFGPILHDWEENGAIARPTKALASVMLVGLVGYQAVWGAWPTWLRLALVVTAVAVLAFVLSRPSPRRAA